MNSKSRLLGFVVPLYCVALVVSNVIAGKLITVQGVVLPAAVLLFPVVYIIGDIVPEVYGIRITRQVILTGFVLNLFAVCFFLLTIALPFPGFWTGQSSFVTVLSVTPRILLASAVGYLIGTNTNAFLMVELKKLTKGRFLWFRTIGSTVFGESFDSLFFITIAFWGTMPTDALGLMILFQATFKIGYEILATPITYLAINRVKRFEADFLQSIPVTGRRVDK